MSENTKRMRAQMGQTIGHTAKTTLNLLAKGILGIDVSDLDRNPDDVQNSAVQDADAMLDEHRARKSACWDKRAELLVHDIKYFDARKRYECARCGMPLDVAGLPR